MKKTKGCLISFFVIFLIGVLLFWLYKKNTIDRLETLDSQVSKQWEKTAKLVTSKNSQLKLEANISDSLKFYIQEFDRKSNLKFCDSNFINIEYAINRIAVKDGVRQKYVDELNLKSATYNSLVRNYNTQRHVFPAFLVLRKSGLKDYFKYFEIEYGVQNESPQTKRKKTYEWMRKIEDSILK